MQPLLSAECGTAVAGIGQDRTLTAGCFKVLRRLAARAQAFGCRRDRQRCPDAMPWSQGSPRKSWT
ncbi:hypothetical protein, partial [Proteus vulgaris]|uniref:hypothetical protein n=1 Tax=Proteus vulgaris TaxID=585 RepID=UPI001953DAA8